MGIIKKVRKSIKPEIEATKRSVAAQMQRSATASYNASIDETLDADDLDPRVKDLLLGSLVETRDSELERIRKRYQ